jgi:hypothetical protein
MFYYFRSGRALLILLMLLSYKEQKVEQNSRILHEIAIFLVGA